MTTSVRANNVIQKSGKLSFERILIPLDGSSLAEGILPVATDLARRINARIDLLSVVDPESTELPSFLHFEQLGPSGTITMGRLISTEDIQQDRIRTADEYLRGVVESLRRNGIRVGMETTVGDPAQQIVAKARRDHIDVIAMATHGRSAIGRGLLGSVTDKVTHSSAVPILVVRTAEGSSPEPISRLVVGLDGSTVAEAALDSALELAKSLGVPMSLVRATSSGARAGAYGFEPDFAPAAIFPITDGEARKYLDTITASQSKLDLDVETRVGPGSAYDEIQVVATEHPGSLIVLATRGRSGLTRWVLGSVTSRTIRSSDSPVLVIPPSIGSWS
jgi:nucleotide-binding universal stress UspA family protein